MDLEYSFDGGAEALLASLQPWESLTAGGLLTALGAEDEGVLEEVLDMLAEKGIVPDVADLPRYSADTEMSVRLRREEQLVQKGNIFQSLEDTDPLKMYLEEIASIPTCGDLNILAEELAEENKRATQDAPIRNRVLNACLRYVVEKAYGFVGNGVLLMDLIQEGSMGLWQDLSDYTAGDFQEFLDKVLVRHFSKAIILQAHAAGVGQKLRQTVEDYRAVDERLLGELGRNPTIEEIAEALHITLEEAISAGQMLENARNIRQVKNPEPEELPQEEDQAVEDTAYFQMRQRIAELLSGLSQTDAKLLSLRYGLEGGRPLDAAQTGLKLGLTAEEVTQREIAALSKLRQQ